MVRIAQFQKVSFPQFLKDYQKTCPASPDEIKAIYDAIRLPVRATVGSAGYDFFSTVPIHLEPHQHILIPTGIRARIEPGYVLMLFPRSSLGFKSRFQLDNSVGIVDSDYSNAENEGHIFLRMTNDTYEGKTLTVSPGEAVAQGIFIPFGITMDDSVTDKRHGGFGSTNRKE